MWLIGKNSKINSNIDCWNQPGVVSLEVQESNQRIISDILKLQYWNIDWLKKERKKNCKIWASRDNTIFTRKAFVLASGWFVNLQTIWKALSHPDSALLFVGLVTVKCPYKIYHIPERHISDNDTFFIFIVINGTMPIVCIGYFTLSLVAKFCRLLVSEGEGEMRERLSLKLYRLMCSRNILPRTLTEGNPFLLEDLAFSLVAESSIHGPIKWHSQILILYRFCGTCNHIKYIVSRNTIHFQQSCITDLFSS